MNQLEQVLNDDVSRLLDRLAASVPGGCLATQDPGLRRRLEETESQMGAARAAMLEGYGRWRRALEDAENLWALAAWKSAGEEATEQSPSIAA